MALCMVYRAPYRGLGSDVPSGCASASRAGKRKRKAGGVRHPEAPTRARRRQQLHGRIEDDDDAMSFAQILERELLSYFETTENSLGGERAAPKSQDKPNGGGGGDDDEVMEISLDEFLSSSADHAVPPPPCAAQLESAAATTDGDVIEFIPEKLMVASASSPDDDDDMCCLACPPMDEDYVELILSEPLVQFDPAFIEEFISDP